MPDNTSNKKIEKLFKDIHKTKIGISWKSSRKINKLQNISLTEMLSIFPSDKFDFINLQYGDIDDDIKDLKKNSGQEIIVFKNFDYKNNIDNLASLILKCDLVLSIASFTAQLSGALGKETWVLAPLNAQWFWHDNRRQSLWYPSVKIFKQKKTNSWTPVLSNIKYELIKKYKP